MKYLRLLVCLLPALAAAGPAKTELKQKLTDLQYRVTQEDATEPPFKNEFWNNHEPGLYVDIVSGEPLFSSLDKFDSGTGWPSFTKPLAKDAVTEKSDRTLFMTRTEVRSTKANSHLGHVFDDGPAPTGLRYCINSAALRFVPVARLEAEGYGQYAQAFAEAAKTEATAYFAGGCFWCMEPPFEKLDGVKAVVSGYTGGTKKDPTYDEVSSGSTGHIESIRVEYDPTKVSYAKLLDVFWRNIDPTDAGGQFVDRGPQYRSAIFVRDAAERAAAEKSKADLGASGVFKGKIATEILDASTFYDAEDYHQDYYKNNPIRYKYYRNGSGRDQFLDKTWGAGR